MSFIIKFFLWWPIILYILYTYKTSKEKYLIDSDIRCQNVRKKRKKSFVYFFLCDSFFRTIFYKRINKDLSLVKLIFKPEHSFIISPNLSIGESLNYSHPYCSFLNANKIGRNFKFRHCTTLGNKIDGRNDLIPSIGDSVTLVANVCIIGDVTIGDNVVVGAGCVITKSVPSNSVVVGNPMRIIPKY